jgi:deazaflavin-dependent oxidoreductase (nitroreductase family)
VAGLAGGSWAVVGTNGGAAGDPAWLLNLRDSGRAYVRHRSTSYAMRARDATADEWAALWPAIIDAYPGFEGYRLRRARGAPIMILEPGS